MSDNPIKEHEKFKKLYFDKKMKLEETITKIKKKKIKNKRKKMSDNPIKEDEKQLIGIDFNDFGNNSSNENVNSFKDDPIIKEISII